jgi:hypothetical protein
VEGQNAIPFDRVSSGVAASMEAVGEPGEAKVEVYLWT